MSYNFIKEFLMEIFFPSKCVFCGKYTEGYVCKHCSKYLKFPKYYCLTCGYPLTVKSQICYNCSKEKLFWQGYEFVAYYEGMWKEIIELYKFKNKPFLAKFLAELGKEKILKRGWEIDFITYVPLNYSNLKKRGYNQSEYLAYFLSKYLRIPYGPLLYLKKEIKAQKALSYKERELNVLNAFEVIKKEDRYIENILLVDDVYTTGSTLRECVRTMRESLKLDRVYVFTAVRALI